MINPKIIEFAKSQGYESAIYLNKWNGFDVYEPVMKSKDVSFIGLPLVILVQGDIIRMSTSDEAFQQIDELK